MIVSLEITKKIETKVHPSEEIKMKSHGLFAQLVALAALTWIAAACGASPDATTGGGEAFVSTSSALSHNLVVGCGNGVLEPELGESCDDGNTISGNGCSATCEVEPGYVCIGERPSYCSPPDRGDGPASYGEALHGRGVRPVSAFSGQDFWTAFPTNLFPPSALALRIVGEPGTAGSVRSKDDSIIGSFTLPASGVATIQVPASYHVMAAGAVGTQGVHITADGPIRVIAMNEAPYSTETWSAWATPVLGEEYRILDLEGYSNAGQQLLIIGTEDGTAVELVSNTGLVLATPTLDKGSTYLHRTYDSNAGAIVRATKPIAVIVSGFCDVLDQSCNMTAEQLPPVRSWAKDYVVAPGFPGTTTISRHAVMAAMDDTAVVLSRGDGTTLSKVLAAGERWIFAETSDPEAGYLVSADKPVAVATIFGDADPAKQWNPSLLYWPPLDGYVAEARLVTSGHTLSYDHFLTLIARTSSTGSVLLNGAAVGAWQAIGGTGYSYARVSVPAGSNDVAAVDGVKFGVVGTGGATQLSYGYADSYDIGTIGGFTTCYLGSTPPDYEASLAGSWSADADDLDGIDDEDALEGTTSIAVGDPFPTLTVACNDDYLGESVGATVHAWIDFNRDGTFSTDERASAPCVDPGPHADGSATLQWNNPTYGDGGLTLIRLRICEAGTTCDTPTGYVASGEVEDHLVHLGTCGDAFHDSFEGCDDGNTTGGDGCSATCTVEPGFVCEGSPSFCRVENPPSIDQPTDGSLTNQSSVIVSGSCENGATVRVFVDDAVACITTCKAGSYSCRAAGLSEGAHEVKADQRIGPLTSTYSPTITIGVDTSLPNPPVLTAPVDGTHSNDQQPTVEGSCEPGATVTVRSGGTLLCTATCSMAGEFSCTTTSLLPEGEHELRATQTDVGGKTSAPSDPRTITVDTTAPDAPTITAPTEGDTVLSSSVPVSGSCEIGATVRVYEGLGELCSASCSGGSYGCNTIPLSSGPHAIHARQFDRAGNGSGFSPIRSFVVDSPPDAPTFLTPAEGAQVNRPVITVSCIAGNEVTIQAGGTMVCSGLCPSSTFSCEPSLADGPHTLTAMQEDGHGRTSPSSSRTFTLDTIPPVAPVITSPTDGGSSNDDPLEVSGSCEAGAVVEVFVDGASACVAPCVAGSFSCDVIGLSDGTHTIHATQEDEAGNESDPSPASSFVVDTTPPLAPTIASPTGGSTTASTTPTFSGACESGATVTVSAGGVDLCTATCVSSAYSCVTLPLADGSHTVTATQQDPAGHASAPSAPVTFAIDTTVPGAPTISAPAPDALIGTDSPSVEGSCTPGLLVTVREGATILCSETCSAAGTYACAAGPLADGPHSIEVSQSNAAGTSGPTAELDFTVDTIPPAAPVFTSPTEGALLATSSPSFEGSCEAGAIVYVTTSAGFCFAVCTPSSTFSCTIPPFFGEGSQSAVANQVDPAGNFSPDSAPRGFIIDTVPPAAPVVTSPTDGGLVTVDTPIFEGSCEPGALVSIHEGATLLCSATCQGDSSFSCQSTPLTDGSHTTTATQTDPAGNTSPDTSLTFDVDATPPPAPGITTPVEGSWVNTTIPTIEGSCETGATVTVSEGADVLCTATCAASAFSCVSAALSEGPHTLTAQQRIGTGNVSDPSAPRSFQVDSLPPAAPTIAAPAEGSFLATTTPTFSGACETGATVTVREGATTLCTATCAASSFSCVSSTLADGPHTLTATQQDQAGNTGPASGPHAFTVDTVPPARPTVGAPGEGAWLSSLTPNISGSCETGATVSVMEGATTLCTATCAAGAYSCASSPLAQGAHTVTATQRDPAGNVSDPSDPRSFNVDTFPPAAPTISEPAAGAFLSTSTPEIVGSCETNAVVAVYEGSTELCTATCVSSTFRCTSSSLVDGSHSVVARQTDVAGNTGNNSNPRAFTVDTTAPDAPTLASPVEGAHLDDDSPTFSGSCESGASVTVSEGGSVLCTASCTGGSYACVSSPLAEGPHTVTAQQVDTAGNPSATSAPRSFVVDTVEPDAPVITAPADGASLATAQPAISGSCETGAHVEVREGAALLCTATCAASTFSCVPGPLSEGSHTVTAEQVDGAGNRSPTSNPVSFEIDTTPPLAPTLTSPVSGDTLTTPTPIFVGTGEPGSTATVSVDGREVCDALVQADGSWSCTSGLDLEDGSHVVEVSAEDPVGNVTPSETVTHIVIDTSAPAAPSILVPSEGQEVGSHPTFIGVAEPSSLVEVWVDGDLVCTAEAGADGLFSCISSDELSVGTREAIAVSIDAAGNASAPSAPVSFEVVAAAGPSQPVIHVPAEGSVVSTSTPTYQGEATPGAMVKVWVDGVEVCTTTATPSGTFSCSPTHSLADGDHVARAIAANARGESQPSLDRHFSVDTAAPIAPTLTHPANGSVVGPWPVFAGTAEPGSVVTVRIGGVVICTATADEDGDFSCMGEDPLPAGTTTAEADAEDEAGNRSGSTSTTFEVQDAAAPDVVIVHPSAGQIVGHSPVSFSGRTEPGAQVTVSEVGGGSLCTATATSEGLWTCAAALSDGPYAVEATASNGSGTGAPGPQVDFIVDTAAPAEPTLSTPADGSTVGPWPVYSGTAEAGSQVWVFVDGSLVCIATTSTDGEFSCTSQAPLAAGAHAAHAIAVDGAGHASERTADNGFTVGQEELGLESPSLDDEPTSDSNPTFSGTAQPGEKVSVIVDGTTVCTVTADNDGAWSCTPSHPIPDGSHEVLLRGDDGFGAIRTRPVGTLVVDTQAPAAPVITSPADGARLLVQEVGFEGTAEPGALVQVYANGDQVCSATASESGTWSCDASLARGSYEVWATATDAAGNVSQRSPTQALEIASELGTPRITSPEPGAYLTSTEVSFEGRAPARTTVTVYGKDGEALCSVVADDEGYFICDAEMERGTHEVHAISTWEELESERSGAVEFTIAGAGYFAGGGCASAAGSTSGWTLLALLGLALGASRRRPS